MVRKVNICVICAICAICEKFNIPAGNNYLSQISLILQIYMAGI